VVSKDFCLIQKRPTVERWADYFAGPEKGLRTMITGETSSRASQSVTFLFNTTNIFMKHPLYQGTVVNSTCPRCRAGQEPYF
jgi:hypothetical protein